MDALELIRQNLEIENFISPAGELSPKPGRETTLLVVYRHAGGQALFFHAGLPNAIRAQIAILPPDALLHAAEGVRLALAPFAPQIETFSGIGCYFPAPPPLRDYPDVVRQGQDFVILVDGRRASWAWTPNQSPDAAELAVETLPALRGRGFGRQVAAAWAAATISAGKTAFYSYRRGNTLSEALANSLGVVRYAQFNSYSVAI